MTLSWVFCWGFKWLFVPFGASLQKLLVRFHPECWDGTGPKRDAQLCTVFSVVAGSVTGSHAVVLC